MKKKIVRVPAIMIRHRYFPFSNERSKKESKDLNLDALTSTYTV